MPRRSYDQYCAIARSLDVLGERWTLLVLRELLAGPRRYTDLHADLPGISTDVLAARLRELEADGLAVRRRLPAPGGPAVYQLTERGRAAAPVLEALAAWGVGELAERRPQDAVRAHWFALPLARRVAEAAGPAAGVVEVRLDEGTFHLRLAAGAAPEFSGGPPQAAADATLAAGAAACLALVRGETSLATAVKAGEIAVSGEGRLATALRGVDGAGD